MLRRPVIVYAEPNVTALEGSMEGIYLPLLHEPEACSSR